MVRVRGWVMHFAYESPLKDRSTILDVNLVLQCTESLLFAPTWIELNKLLVIHLSPTDRCLHSTARGRSVERTWWHKFPRI